MQFEVKWSFLFFFVFITLTSILVVGGSGGIWAAILIVTSLLLHEAAHVLLARCYGISVKKVGISAVGAYTVRDRAPRPRTEALITVGGPVMSLLLFLVFISLAGKVTNWVADCNLVVAAANLLPIGPSDGARLLRIAVAVLRAPA